MPRTQRGTFGPAHNAGPSAPHTTRDLRPRTQRGTCRPAHNAGPAAPHTTRDLRLRLRQRATRAGVLIEGSAQAGWWLWV